MLNLKNESFAQPIHNKDILFTDLATKIQKKDICEIQYSRTKTAAIVNIDCGSVAYINFKTQQTYPIIDHWPNVFHPVWIDENIAHIEGPCGTGCSQSIIFIAPKTVLSCATHEYRIKNLNFEEPPDYYNNRPFLIDPKKGIYVCYDDENNIRAFPLTTYPSTKYPTIHPPKGYFAETATLRHDWLVITYKNAYGKIKRIAYEKIENQNDQ